VSAVARRRRLYGLGVESDAPIAALSGLPGCARGDVRWNLESMPPGYESLGGEAWEEYRRVEDSCLRASRLQDGSLYRLAYDDGTEFVVLESGAEVWARSAPGASLEDTATYLLGPVMGFVLRLRGITCLHASVVAIDGQAIAFAGHAGSGKSTLAAAFARRGHAILAEDVAALAIDAEGIQVEPAYPGVRLWPESVASLFGAPDALPTVTPGWEKRYLGLDDGRHRFQPGRLPLAAIYVLAERAPEGLRTSRLAPATALMALVERAYSASLLDRAMRAREFETLGHLTARIPVHELALPDDIAKLPQSCDRIAARHSHA
jgi:hypothetical protein